MSPYLEYYSTKIKREDYLAKNKARCNSIVNAYANGLIEFGPDVEAAFKWLAEHGT